MKVWVTQSFPNAGTNRAALLVGTVQYSVGLLTDRGMARHGSLEGKGHASRGN